MTAIAAIPAAVVRPVPWPRLAWVVWRRYRTTLLATLGVLAAIAVYLTVTGEQMRSSYDAATACRPVNSTACMYKFNVFHNSYAQPGIIGAVLMFLPAIIGCFVGAPLLSRELETGTFRYAWTQGAGRMRWASAILASGAIGVAVIVSAFGGLITWRNQPLFDSGFTPRLHQTVFPETGVAAAGWALAGFGVGVLGGLLWRRVVPAIVTAFAACFGLEYLGATYRSHYLTPLTTTSLDQPLKALTISQWWTKGGVRISSDQVTSALSAVGASFSASGGKITSAAGGTANGAGVPNIDPVQYLIHHGYAQVTSYQPDRRYWPLQWIEFGWLSAVAVVLLGTAMWLLRRRPA
jgi:hypothetical protein